MESQTYSTERNEHLISVLPHDLLLPFTIPDNLELSDFSAPLKIVAATPVA